MLSAQNSRLLAKIKQIAVYNGDLKMIKKIQSIKKDEDITEIIINYRIKEKK